MCAAVTHALGFNIKVVKTDGMIDMAVDFVGVEFVAGEVADTNTDGVLILGIYNVVVGVARTEV